MLTLRPQQLAILAEALVPAYEEQMQKHLREHFPHQMAELRDSEITELIRSQRIRARAYGFASPRAWGRYTALAVALGGDFDTRIPWAQDILGASTEPRRRLEELERRTIDHLWALEDEKRHRPTTTEG